MLLGERAESRNAQNIYKISLKTFRYARKEVNYQTLQWPGHKNSGAHLREFPLAKEETI